MGTTCKHADVERRFLGVDLTDGRYADVTYEACHACGLQWVHYQFEFEAFSRSGRWYRGQINSAQAEALTAANAAALLEALAAYTAGGSYFDGQERERSGPLV